MNERVLLDPGSERAASARPRTERPPGLDGVTVGLLDISKARGDVFLDRLAQLLEQRGAAVRRYRKPTFTRVAPIELKQRIAAECRIVVEGLAD